MKLYSDFVDLGDGTIYNIKSISSISVSHYERSKEYPWKVTFIDGRTTCCTEDAYQRLKEAMVL